jgi:ankyrin repeat protein
MTTTLYFDSGLTDIIDRETLEPETEKRQKLALYIENDLIEELEKLLQENPHLISTFNCETGETPLHYAAQCSKQPTIIEELLDRGANPCARDKKNKTAIELRQAIDYSNGLPWAFVIFYEQKMRVNIFLASFIKKIDICELHVNDEIDSQGNTLLHYAMDLELEDYIKHLLEKKADPFAKNKKSLTPMDLFWYKSITPDTLNVILRCLMTYRRNAESVNEVIDRQGRTLLHYAVRYGSLEDIKTLLTDGADPLAKDNKGRYPIFAALKICEIHDERVNIPIDRQGRSLLHYAVGYGRKQDVETLLTAGADPFAQDNKKQYPLDMLNLNESYFTEIFKKEIFLKHFMTMLKTEKMDVNQVIDRQGNRLIHYIVALLKAFKTNNNLNMLKILIENGADVLVKNNNGETACSLVVWFYLHDIDERITGTVNLAAQNQLKRNVAFTFTLKKYINNLCSKESNQKLLLNSLLNCVEMDTSLHPKTIIQIWLYAVKEKFQDILPFVTLATIEINKWMSFSFHSSWSNTPILPSEHITLLKDYAGTTFIESKIKEETTSQQLEKDETKGKKKEFEKEKEKEFEKKQVQGTEKIKSVQEARKNRNLELVEKLIEYKDEPNNPTSKTVPNQDTIFQLLDNLITYINSRLTQPINNIICEWAQDNPYYLEVLQKNINFSHSPQLHKPVAKNRVIEILKQYVNDQTIQKILTDKQDLAVEIEEIEMVYIPK